MYQYNNYTVQRGQIKIYTGSISIWNLENIINRL